MLERALEPMLGVMTSHKVRDSSIIPWSAPVPSFGDPEAAQVATLGLNPSNKEFVDNLGQELDGSIRRFPTLASLALEDWSGARRKHRTEIARACRNYFRSNPYDLWFGKLDRLLAKTGASYYGPTPDACHLDLIPYATAKKWTALRTLEKQALFALAGDSLGLLLERSKIRVLVLNGRSVVEGFQELSGSELDQRKVPSWTLNRSASEGVTGISYTGVITKFGARRLRRRVYVLGFNHNIQSSFGVTSAVTESIGDWLGQRIKSLGP